MPAESGSMTQETTRREAGVTGCNWTLAWFIWFVMERYDHHGLASTIGYLLTTAVGYGICRAVYRWFAARWRIVRVES